MPALRSGWAGFVTGPENAWRNLHFTVDIGNRLRYKRHRMSDSTRRVLCLSAVGLLLGSVAFRAAGASTINGSIAFNGTPVFDNTNDVSLATRFTALNNASVAPGQQFGDYATIPDNQTAAFAPFIFVPTTVPASPLWQVTFNGTTYSFFATTMIASYDSELRIWNIGGDGFARVDNFADTPGTWNFSAGQIGQSFYFGSSSVAVPEPSSSALVLLSVSCLLGWRMRARQRLEK
jgi:hypothetical protein